MGVNYVMMILLGPSFVNFRLGFGIFQELIKEKTPSFMMIGYPVHLINYTPFNQKTLWKISYCLCQNLKSQVTGFNFDKFHGQ